MKVCYASRTGNVEALVGSLGLDDALRINDGSESINEDYILITYTDGYGDIPAEVEAFLASNSANLKGVIASGDKSYGDAYGLAGDKIAEQYNVPLLYKLENSGTDEEIAEIQVILNK